MLDICDICTGNRCNLYRKPQVRLHFFSVDMHASFPLVRDFSSKPKTGDNQLAHDTLTTKKWRRHMPSRSDRRPSARSTTAPHTHTHRDRHRARHVNHQIQIVRTSTERADDEQMAQTLLALLSISAYVTESHWHPRRPSVAQGACLTP